MEKLKLGMVGGGKDAFIGAVHRIASRIDGHFDLVAGALSSSAEKSRESGLALGLDPARCYGNYEEMAQAEADRPDGIDVVSIVTPNHVHGPASMAFLSRGIHVICDKPLTATLEQADELAKAVQASDALFILTHNYTGYPMIRQAREMIKSGKLGALRLVQVEYPQDWMTKASETEGESKQAEWRLDPARSGLGGSIGDIGTHAYNLACFVSGLRAETLAADLQSFVPGRQLDDNAHVMLRFEGGVRGMLWCSQVAPGNENALKLRIYGDNGGLEWAQEDPNYLWFTEFGKPRQLLTRAGAGDIGAPGAITRTPGGHPEGFLEGFANIYTGAAEAIRASKNGQRAEILDVLPGLDAGLDGMKFISACVRSSQDDSAWTAL